MKLERLKLSDDILGWKNRVTPRVVISGRHGWLLAGVGFEGHRVDPHRRRLFMTSDGRTFRPVDCPLGSPTQLLGTEHGVVVVEGAALLCSDDGRRWRELPATPGVRVSLSAATAGPLLAIADGALVQLDDTAGAWRTVSATVPASGLLSAGPEMHFVRSTSELFRIKDNTFVKATGLPKKCTVVSVAQLTNGKVFALSDESALFRSSDGLAFEPVVVPHTELRQLAALNDTVIIIDREAVLTSADEGKTFVHLSRNPDAGFASAASYGEGALIVDSRRHAVFLLAPKADSFWQRDPAPRPEVVVAGTPAEMVEASDGSDYRPYAVFTDWLQAAGDPLGEIIAQLNRLQGNAVAMQLIERHAQALVGSMRPSQVTWRFGFVESARFDSASVELLRLTAGRFTRELVFISHEVAPAAFIAQLGGGVWPAVRKVAIDGTDLTDEDGLTWYQVGPLETLWRALPRLESLVVSGEGLSAGTVNAATLRSLKLVGPRASARLGSLPNLEHLTLGLLGEPFDAHTLSLPKLTVLNLVGTTNTDEVIEQVANSPLCAQLTELSVFGGSLDDPGVVVRNAERLAHLKVVDLGGNRLSAEGVSAITAVLPRASLAAQGQYDEHTLGFELTRG